MRMKYCVPLLLLVIALLLTACMSGLTNSNGQTTAAPAPTATVPITNNSATEHTIIDPIPTTTAPVPSTTSPVPTTVPTVPVPPTVPQNTAELNAFNELFSNPRPEKNPYFRATGCEYASVKDIKLKAFFDGGFPGEHEKTDAEWTELSKMLNFPEFVQGDFNRLPKDKMDAELQAVFGISLNDLPDSAYEGLYYLKSTDCYYFFQSGMTSAPIIGPFLDLVHNNDGTVALTYSNSIDNYIITLTCNGDSYLILSNVKTK